MSILYYSDFRRSTLINNECFRAKIYTEKNGNGSQQNNTNI